MTLRREHIVALVNGKSAKRFAGRNFLKTLRVLMTFAIENGALRENPTAGVKNLSGKTDGYATWSEEHIAMFRAHYPVGSRERLALELLLCTAQRRSDVVKMGRQHLRKTKDGTLIDVRQQKTGTSLAIPVHPDLHEALDAMPTDNMTFLTTHQGRGFSAAGFTNWFRDACKAAGLQKGFSAHGLRKAACRRLAEAGCSANVIAAISGHKSLDEIELYTRAADQVRMAREGMAALVRQNANTR
ncbi:integrase [Bradyrhizobium sp. GM2.2]|uniref:tyrosine-type recombinase/integrase n=1 Tax=Bradyrhizobium sp. GM2.2 TaxID=3156358 RepID=UPI0033945AA7